MTILLPDLEDRIHEGIVQHHSLRWAESEQTPDLVAVDAVLVALRHGERLGLWGLILGVEVSIEHSARLPQREAESDRIRLTYSNRAS